MAVFYAHERLWTLGSMQRLAHKRLLKVALWKVVAVSMTVATTVAITGELSLALRLGPLDFLAKLGLYYAHEVLWEAVSFGRTVAAAPTSEKLD